MTSKYEEYKEKIAAAHREGMDKNPDADKVDEIATSMNRGKPTTLRESMEKSLASEEFYQMAIGFLIKDDAALDEYVDAIRNNRLPAVLERASKAPTRSAEEVLRDIESRKRAGKKGPRHGM